MKFLLTISVITLQFAVRGQNHELQVLYKFGFSTNNFHSPLYNDPKEAAAIHWSNAKLLYDQTTEITYKYQIWKKAKIFLLGGGEIGQTKYYIPIIGFIREEIADVNFHQNKAGYMIGALKRFELYGSKVKIDIGFKFKDVYPFQRNLGLTQDWTMSETSEQVKYQYSLDVKYRYYTDITQSTISNRFFADKFQRIESFVNIQFNAYKNWYINVQLSYQRNNVIHYDLKYYILYHYPALPNPNNQYFEYYNGLDLGSRLFMVNNDLIYTTLGVSYFFTNKEKREIKK